MNWRLMFAALASGVLLLAGCAGEKKDTAADPSSTPGATATATAGPSVPAGPVPESLRFTARTLDGKNFDGASLAGKPAVLWFWAPWCPKCRAAAADVAKAAQQVAMVGVPGLSDDTASMRDFVTSTKTGAFPHLGQGAGEVWRKFGVTSQHTYVLIRSDGSIAYQGTLDAAGLHQRIGQLS